MTTRLVHIGIGLVMLTWGASSVMAQKKRPIKGVVYNAATERPLYRAEVRSEKYSRKTATDGTFELDIVRGRDIKVRNVGYHTRTIPFDRYRNLDSIAVYMTPTTTQLSNVISAGPTQTVYQNNFENVKDYAFLGDTLAVLAFMEYKPRTPGSGETYMRNTLNFTLRGVEVARVLLPDGLSGLYHDAFNRLWAVGDGLYYEVKRSRDGFVLEQVDKDFIQREVLAIEAASPRSAFFSFMMPIVPQITYQVYLPNTGEFIPFRYIRNDAYFRDAHADYRMLNPDQRRRARELQEEHNINEVLFAPYIRAYDRREHYGYPITQGFNVDGTFIIFDMFNSWIYHHDAKGYPVDSVFMYHHNFEGEKYQGLLQDRVSGRVYALHSRGGAAYLRKVNALTGAAGRPVKINNAFPETVRIHDGWLYYTFRKPESGEFRKLLRERLP